MPRYRPTQVAAKYDRDAMVEELARELASNETFPIKQPLIYEEPVAETNTDHVVVVWDRWSEVPSEERGGIILDAYQKFDAQSAKNVTVAIGATVEEAIDLNLLPYQVISMARRGEADPSKIKKALLEEGAVQTAGGLILALPAETLATEVHRRLETKEPNGHWGIKRTVARIVD